MTGQQTAPAQADPCLLTDPNAGWFNKVKVQVRRGLDAQSDATRGAPLSNAIQHIYTSRRLYDEHQNRGRGLTTTLAGAVIALVGYAAAREANPDLLAVVFFLGAAAGFGAGMVALRYRLVLSASCDLYFATIIRATHVYFAFGLPAARPWFTAV